MFRFLASSDLLDVDRTEDFALKPASPCPFWDRNVRKRTGTGTSCVSCIPECPPHVLGSPGHIVSCCRVSSGGEENLRVSGGRKSNTPTGEVHNIVGPLFRMAFSTTRGATGKTSRRRLCCFRQYPPSGLFSLIPQLLCGNSLSPSKAVVPKRGRTSFYLLHSSLVVLYTLLTIVQARGELLEGGPGRYHGGLDPDPQKPFFLDSVVAGRPTEPDGRTLPFSRPHPDSAGVPPFPSQYYGKESQEADKDAPFSATSSSAPSEVLDEKDKAGKRTATASAFVERAQGPRSSSFSSFSVDTQDSLDSFAGSWGERRGHDFPTVLSSDHLGVVLKSSKERAGAKQKKMRHPFTQSELGEEDGAKEKNKEQRWSCRDWRAPPHPCLSKQSARESLRVPENFEKTSALMPFSYYSIDNRGYYVMVTKFADFDAAEIRKRLTASDIRSFFRFKNLAWFGRLSPLPLMKTVVVADAANVNIPRTLYHGGLSTAKTYIQAMTSTIPMIGVRVAEVHVVNVPAAGVILLSLIKALSPKEMEFFVHRTINDFRAYAAEHIGIDNLPEHFGGTNKCPMDDTEMERCFSQFCQEAMMTEERKKSTTLDQETLAKLHDEARKKRVSAEIEESFDDLGD